MGRAISASVELAIPLQRLPQPSEVLARGNLKTPEPLQVWRRRLRVEQLKPALAKSVHQVHQGDFTRVAPAEEHALAEERAAQRHAVQPAGQLVFLPRLDAVRVAQLVQLLVDGDQLFA